VYGNKKEALGLSTHHLIGCKDIEYPAPDKENA
jgi:hypothetical protein